MAISYDEYTRTASAQSIGTYGRIGGYVRITDVEETDTSVKFTFSFGETGWNTSGSASSYNTSVSTSATVTFAGTDYSGTASGSRTFSTPADQGYVQKAMETGKTKTVSKTSSSQSITVKISYTYSGTTKTKTQTITIPAITQYTITAKVNPNYTKYNGYSTTQTIVNDSSSTWTIASGSQSATKKRNSGASGIGNVPDCTIKVGSTTIGDRKQWWTGAGGTGTQYTSSAPTISANATIYPKYEFTEFTITLNGNGGTIDTNTSWSGSGSSVTKERTYGETLGNMPWASMTRTGYSKDGSNATDATCWYTTQTGGTMVPSTTPVTGAKTYYAHWLINLTPTAYSAVWDGSAHSASIKAGAASTTVNYGTSTSYGNTVTVGTSNVAMSSVTRTAVGTTTVYYRGINTGCVNYTTGSTSITITRASVGAKPATTISKVYTGSSQTNGYTTPSYVTASGSTSGTAVGSYAATYTPDSNHMWSDGTYAAVTRTLTITQRTVTPTAPTLTTGTLTYDGSAKTLATAGSCTAGGTMYYYVGTSSTAPTFSTSTWSTSMPTKTDAGTYYVFWYCYVSDTTNNTGTNINTANRLSSSRVINKAANPITYSNSGWAATFSTSAQTKTLNAASNAVGTVTYSISGQYDTYTGDTVNYFTLNSSTRVLTMAASTPVPTDSYQVDVTASAAGNSNYNSGSKMSSIDVTVAKAANPITWGTTGTWQPTYSTSAQSTSITAPTNAQGTVTYSITSQKQGSTAVSYFSVNSSTGAITIAGSTPANVYTVVVRATAAGNSNYNSGYKEKTFTITEKVTITLNDNGGSGGSGTVTVLYGTTAGNYPSVTRPTRPGYTFLGYYSATSGGTQWYNSEPSSVRTFNLTAPTTWYAQWSDDLTAWVRVGGAWKDVTKMWVRVEGAWKEVTTISSRIGGSWKSQ